LPAERLILVGIGGVGQLRAHKHGQQSMMMDLRRVTKVGLY